jgi:hypothetical protein
MNDEQILETIERLVDEEHRLLRLAEQGGLGPEDHRRLEAVKVVLDRFWDLLRQRRAREEFGLDPDRVSSRDEPTVEGYLQ